MQSADNQEVFISKVKIIDPSSEFNGKILDIHIVDGLIHAIGKNLKQPFGAHVIEEKKICASPGFLDMHVNVQDPGYEFKEDIASALNAAASGGFTGILSCSTTDPCVDNKSAIEYQQRKAGHSLVDFYPSGALSKGQRGEELAEMYDMHRAGARAFYDFKSNVSNSQLLKLALLYTKSFDGLIMLHPSEDFLTADGQVNEGIVSTRNGLKGMPAIAEEIGIMRTLKLSEYTESRIHFTCISTVEGLDLIRKAKKKGLPVTCGVSVANLLFSEEDLSLFQSHYKVNPPLRDDKTRKALIDGLKKGIIDVVVSDHWPQNVENKECEFDLADFGMNTLESAFAMLNSAVDGKLEPADLVKVLSQNPRQILNLEQVVIKEKEKANLTIYQPDLAMTYPPENSLSVSANFADKAELKGKVIASINNQKVQQNI